MCDSCKLMNSEKSGLEILYKECSEFVSYLKFIKLLFFDRACGVSSSRFEGILCKKYSTLKCRISFFLAIHDESPFRRPYRVSQFVRKFRRRANFARMDRWCELVHGKFRMTESVACKFLFTGRYIFRDAMLANVSIRERPNNSYSTHLCTDR